MRSIGRNVDRGFPCGEIAREGTGDLAADSVIGDPPVGIPAPPIRAPVFSAAAVDPDPSQKGRVEAGEKLAGPIEGKRFLSVQIDYPAHAISHSSGDETDRHLTPGMVLMKKRILQKPPATGILL